MSVGKSDLPDQIRRFADEVVGPAAPSWAKGRAPDPVLFRKAADLGLFRLQVPHSEGGLGMGFMHKAYACEALAAADFGFAMSVVNTHNVAARIASSGSDETRASFLPALLWGESSACTALTEPAAGSDIAAMQTRATKAGGKWVLNGEKCWIVNARHASTAIVYAQTADQGDIDGIAAFVVDLTASGCRRYATSSDFAQSSAGTGGFVLTDLTLPEANMILSPGQGFRSIMEEINGARTYVAAMCCGMMEAGLRHAAAHGARRRAFGKPLSAHQGWRMPLARAETALAAARALTDIAIAAVDGGHDAQLQAALAKVAATDAATTHLPALLHAMGAEGLDTRYPMARHLAAAQIATLVDGSTEMLLERIARLARPILHTSN